MRVHIAHHAAQAPDVLALVDEFETHHFERTGPPAEADLALVLVSPEALRDGLGTSPRRILEAGIRVLPVLYGADLLPRRFPVARKHALTAAEPHALMRLLVDVRKRQGRKIAEGKRDLFGYGLWLSLLYR